MLWLVAVGASVGLDVAVGALVGLDVAVTSVKEGVDGCVYVSTRNTWRLFGSSLSRAAAKSSVGHDSGPHGSILQQPIKGCGLLSLQVYQSIGFSPTHA